MGRRDNLAGKLAALSELDVAAPGAEAKLHASLKLRSCHLVARAAQLVGRHRLEGFDAALLAALDRFYRKPVRTDPGCYAKLALLTALDVLDHPDTAPFYRAALHVQKEPAWGEPVDTAAAFRARAIRAIGRQVSNEALMALGGALADPEPPVRRAAVEAILHRGDIAGAALLSMRVRFFDDDPVVRAECLSALVRLAPEQGLRQLLPMLEGDDEESRELAALALGESRHPAALQALISWLDRSILSAERAVGIMAIGAHRSEAARAFLVELLDEASRPEARLVITALLRQGMSQGAMLDAAADRPELHADIRAAYLDA